MSLWLSPVIVIAIAATPEAPEVRLQLDASLICDLGTSLAGALTEQQVKVAVANDGAAWVLSAHGEGNAVELRLTNPQAVLRGMRRLNPTTADCPALPRTAALLVRSWLAAQLGAALSEPKLAGEIIVTVPDPPPGVASVRPVKPDARLPAPVTPVPALPEAPIVAVKGPVEPAPLAVGVKAAPEFFTSPPSRLQPHSTQSFSVILAGGGALGVGDQPVAMGTLGVEWGFDEPWGVAIDAGLQSPRSHTVTEGSIEVQLQWATLLARRSFFAHGLDGLQVSLGVQLVHLGAAAAGFTTHSSADLLMPGLAASVEWRQTLTRGLFLVARLNVQARLRPQTFTVAGVGTVLTVPPWGFGLEGGVGWNFL